MQNWYPNIYKLVSSIWLSFIHQPIQQRFELTLKYAKITQGKDTDYQKYLQDSKQDIIILNQKPYYKKYKIITSASQSQYQSVILNSFKSKFFKQSIKQYKLQLRFQTQKINKILSNNQQWNRQIKTQKISKQFIVLSGEKQFKIELNSFQRSTGKSISDILNKKKQINQKNVQELAQQLVSIRVSQYTQLFLSQMFYITASKIHLIKKQQQKLKLLQICQQNNPQLINKYIQQNLPTTTQNTSHYQIQLRMPIESKIKQSINNPQFLNTYIGFLIQIFSKLPKQQYDNNFENDFFSYVTSSKQFYKNFNIEFDDL